MAIVAGKIDVVAFEAEVSLLLGDAAAFQAIKDKIQSVSLDPKKFFAQLPALMELGTLIVSAVEVVKTKLAPEGGFDKQVAIDTAAKMFDSLVRFEGIVGSILERFDGFLIKLLLSAIVYGKNMAEGQDWVETAKELLGLA